MLALLLDLKHTLKYYRLKPNSISQNPWTQKAFRELKISGSSSFNIIKTNSRHSRSPLEEGVQTAQPEVWSKKRISTSLAINLSTSYSCFRVLCSLCYLEALKQFVFHFFPRDDKYISITGSQMWKDSKWRNNIRSSKIRLKIFLGLFFLGPCA